MSKGTITCTACSYVFAVPANARAAICPKCGQAQPVLSAALNHPDGQNSRQPRDFARTLMGVGEQPGAAPSPEPDASGAHLARIKLKKQTRASAATPPPPPPPAVRPPPLPPRPSSAWPEPPEHTIPELPRSSVAPPDLPEPPQQLLAELPPLRQPTYPPRQVEEEEEDEDDLDERDTLHVDSPPWQGPAERMQQDELVLDLDRPLGDGEGPAFDLGDLPLRAPAPGTAPPAAPEQTTKWRPAQTTERVAALDQAISSTIDPLQAMEPPPTVPPSPRRAGPANLEHSGIMVLIPEKPVEEVLGGNLVSSVGGTGDTVEALAPITRKQSSSPKGFGVANKQFSVVPRRGVILLLAGGLALALVVGLGLWLLQIFD